MAVIADRLIVIKLGGDVVRDPGGFAALAADLVRARSGGLRFVLVHGGGPQATALMRRLGLEPTFVAGRRVTDEATLEAVIMAVAGQVSTRLVAALSTAGLPALGFSGVSAAMVRARKRPPARVLGGGSRRVDYGRVGDIDSVDAAALNRLIDAGFVPAIACLGLDADGQVLNINADRVASDLAVRLNATGLVAVSGVPGVLSDPADPSSRIPRLTAAEARAAIEAGSISGGMVAKIDEALRALEAGVPRVVITGPPRPGLLRDSLDGGGLAGTEVVV